MSCTKTRHAQTNRAQTRRAQELCKRCANIDGCPLREQFYETGRGPGRKITQCPEFVDVAAVVGKIFTIAELELPELELPNWSPNVESF